MRATKAERISAYEADIRAGLRAFPQKQLRRLYLRITGNQLHGLSGGFGWEDLGQPAPVGCLAGSAFTKDEWDRLETRLTHGGRTAPSQSEHPLLKAAYDSFPKWLNFVGHEDWNPQLEKHVVNGPAVEALARLVKREHQRRQRAKQRAQATA